MNIKLIADSSSNLYTFRDLNYTSVPLKIISGDNEYVDSPELDISLMIDQLKHSKTGSSTSCPNVNDWLEAFDGADAVFAVTITSSLSGCYSAAISAKEQYISEHPQAKIVVFDSLSTGPQMQLLLEKIAECIDSGMTFEQTEAAACEYYRTTHLLFSLQSLTNLARNGRVNPAVAKISEVLGIRVIGKASEKGTLKPLHKSRGEKKALEVILGEMKKNGFSGGKVRISHCLNEAAASELKNNIQSQFPSSDIEIISCTALCSYYAEKGGLIIGYEGAQK